MDYYIEHLKLVIEQNGGIISAAELQKEGINRANIYEGLINGIIQRITRMIVLLLARKKSVSMLL